MKEERKGKTNHLSFGCSTIHKPKWVIKKQITIIKIILSTNYHNYRN